MISQLSLNNKNNSNIHSSSLKSNSDNKSPNFKGKWSVVGLIQKCEKEPMINVAVIDLLTAILPRSIWESLTNLFAGFEAFRRESSGLLVNCLIPGFITLGIAHMFNRAIMGKDKANMANCWASSDTIRGVTDHYKNVEKTEAYQEGLKLFNNNKTHARVYAVNYNMLNEASGIDGYNTVSFNQVMSKEELSDKAHHLTRMMFKSKDGKLTEEIVENTPKKRLKAVYRSIARKTHITQDVKWGESNHMVGKLENTLTNTHKILKGIVKEGIEPANVSDYVTRSIRLLKTKSLLGMAIVIPLAASMQHLNRKWTEKISGVKGAPIHDDYGKEGSEKSPEQIKAEKRSLIGHKIWAVSSMLGVAMLSMLKVPNMNTLKNIIQFKDQFPTMDQARAISAITFASRMAVADDEAELKESHTRDLITFASMYFLGDYGAKGMASYYEKSKGVELLNKTFDPAKNSGFFTKAKNWILNTHLKSSDELKGTGKVLKEAINLRAKCQSASIGTSLAILGVIVPVYTRLRTKKHDKEVKLNAQRIENNQKIIQKSISNKLSHSSSINSRGLSKEFPSLQKFRAKVEVTQ